MSVSDLLMKMGYFGAGGDQESSLDKVNRTIGTVGKLFTDMSARKQQNLQDKLNALKLEEAKANIAKAQAEQELTKPALPSYVKPVGSVLKERQFVTEQIPDPNYVPPIPPAPVDGVSYKEPQAPMVTRVRKTAEPVMQTEQSMEEEYNTLPVSKTISYTDMKQLSKGKIQEILAKRLEQKAVTPRNPNSNESAILSKNYGVDTIKELFPEYRDNLQKLVGVTNAEVAIKKQQQMQQGANSGRDFTQESGLRQEFINRPEVKEFQTMNTNVKSMDSLLNSALAGDQKNKVALDQALISMYNKLTDPQSVVRESEYARTGENIPVVNQIEGAIAKLARGGAGITDADRQALVIGAKIIANERGNTFNSTRNQYETLANQYQIPAGRIVGTISPFTKYDVGSPSQAPQLMVDRVTGVRAMVYPDGRIEEAQ